MSNLETSPAEGNIGLGLLAGLFGGCLGLILVYALAKGPATKKGAVFGLVAQVLISFLVTTWVLRK